MPKKKRPKTISQYKDNIKNYSDFAPTLKKYKNRKKLKRGEKAFISRIANKVRALTSPTTSLISLSPEQEKFIRKSGNKNAIIGGGIRAMSFRKLDNNAKAELIDNELHIKSKGRDWRHKPLIEINIASFIEAGNALFSEANSDPSITRRTVALWSANGGNYLGFTTMRGKQGLGDRIREYFTQYEEQDDWLLGLAYFDE